MLTAPTFIDDQNRVAEIDQPFLLLCSPAQKAVENMASQYPSMYVAEKGWENKNNIKVPYP